MIRGYRVWDNENKSYNDPYSSAYYAMTQDGGLDFYVHGDIWKGADPGTYIVEWDTGLKDKNGKMIKEGDVVNIQGIKYYVDFEHGGFWFNNDNRKWKANRPFTHFQEINDLEVIGNIHENGDLLK